MCTNGVQAATAYVDSISPDNNVTTCITLLLYVTVLSKFWAIGLAWRLRPSVI